MAARRELSNADVVRMRHSLRVFHEDLGGLLRPRLWPVPVASQIATETASLPGGKEQIMEAISQGVLLLESAAENLLLFTKGLDAPVQPMACLVSVRGVLEASAVAAWLLDPTIDAAERARRGVGRRLQGLGEMRKFARATQEDARVDHALSRIEQARQEAAAIGLEPARVPGSTEIITQMLDFEAEYRLLSGVAHGHNWALVQAGYEIAGTVAEPRGTAFAAKRLKPWFAFAVGMQAFRAITRPSWCLVVISERDRGVFSAIVESFYERLGATPKGDLYWRQA